MGRINISFAAVSQKTGELKAQTEQSLLSNIMGRYDNLQGSLEQSSGMGMDAIREPIGQVLYKNGVLENDNLKD